MGDHKSNPFARGATMTLPIQVRDLYGRVLSIGDRVIRIDGLPPQMVVLAVKPVLDPRVPPNTVEVTMRQTLTFLAPADQPLEAVIRILTAEEAGIKPNTSGDKPADAAPPADPAPSTDGSAAPEKSAIRIVE